MEKIIRATPNRGFEDGDENTASQKITMFELLIGQIANFCRIISRPTIVKHSTSTEKNLAYNKVKLRLPDHWCTLP
jgi:hypothetical protein